MQLPPHQDIRLYVVLERPPPCSVLGTRGLVNAPLSDTCAAQTNMQCWASNRMIFDDEQVAIQLSEAWEHDSGKDELNVVLQGLEQHYWRGTEAGWLSECCLLVLNLVSSTLSCIRQPRLRLRVLDICGFVSVCTQAFIGF